MIPSFIRNNPGLALFAFIAVATSGFGQTFFVSVMGGQLREAFGFSHTLYGGLYSGATVLSAVLLFRFGSLADSWSLSKVTALALLILAAGCLLIGITPNALLLGLGFLLIRFGGQGLTAHLGLTTAARYFSAHRGKAVAMAGIGFPLAEGTFPAGAVFLMQTFGWRWPWLSGFAILTLAVLPLLLFLSRKTPAPVKDSAFAAQQDLSISFTRDEVLRDPGFYMLLPAAVITPFVVTAIFFHQVAIAEIQGWSLQLVAKAFSGYAAGHLISLFAAGPVVDRLGAGRTLPLSLLPLSLGLLLLGVASAEWVALVYLLLVGITKGFEATSAGAIWAERYGLIHLGAIRALTQAIMVVSTAIAPVLFGFLFDLQVSLLTLGLSMSLLVIAFSILACTAPQARKKG
jgi:MFS family permease